MKERSILFSAPMVRAILDGSKTQTRRLVKNKIYSNGFHFDGNDILCHNDYLPPSAMLMDVRRGKDGYTVSNLEGWEAECPYGQSGDRLWVRETWMPDAPRDGTWPDVQFFGCKGSPLSLIPERFQKPEHCLHRASWDGSELVGWKPSIHMPRWASRITLEVTGVRVERLQDISETDAWEEGIESCDGMLDDLKIIEAAKRMSPAAPAPTGQPVQEPEIERLRKEQAAAVMPLIGPLLDAYEGMQKHDLKQLSPSLARHLNAIALAVDLDSAAAPSQATATSYCREGDRCVCGGDLPRVREGCGNWAKGGVA